MVDRLQQCSMTCVTTIGESKMPLHSIPCDPIPIVSDINTNVIQLNIKIDRLLPYMGMFTTYFLYLLEYHTYIRPRYITQFKIKRLF